MSPNFSEQLDWGLVAGFAVVAIVVLAVTWRDSIRGLRELLSPFRTRRKQPSDAVIQPPPEGTEEDSAAETKLKIRLPKSRFKMEDFKRWS